MRDVAVRPEPDFAPASQVRRRAPATRRNPRAAWLAPMLRRPGQTVACATFAALLTGICVNALFFQTARHPAPIFGSASAPQPFTSVQKGAPVRPEISVPVPAPRPQEFASTAQPRDAIEPPKDQIGNLLKTSSSSSDDTRTIMAAQRALMRLGYPIKADGMMGASTRQAIEKFEQSRKIPVTGDLTARTLRELAAQSRMAAQ